MPLSNPTATISFPTSTSVTRSIVSASTTFVPLLTLNSARKGVTIWNNSSANLYIELGTSAVTTTSFSVKVGADGYYELPFGYIGPINGIWDGSTGSALVREFT